MMRNSNILAPLLKERSSTLNGLGLTPEGCQQPFAQKDEGISSVKKRLFQNASDQIL